MQLIFLGALLVGLLLGVYAMIRGVERITPTGPKPAVDPFGRPVGSTRMAFGAPTAAAFFTVFGVVGYLLYRYSSLAPIMQATVAGAVALVGMVFAARAVARWASQAAEEDAVDERYLLQGHPARVVTQIPAGGDGEISYVIGGTRYAASAQSVDGSPLPVDTDVVIERVEAGVAYVEPWVQVEQRL